MPKKNQFARVFYAKKTKVDGVTFDSRGEARRYGELKLMQRAGRIKNLSTHPCFDLMIKGVLICRYEGDFAYNIPGYEKMVVEDYKGGIITQEYKIKSKLFKVLYGDRYHFLESGKKARKNR